MVLEGSRRKEKAEGGIRQGQGVVVGSPRSVDVERSRLSIQAEVQIATDWTLRRQTTASSSRTRRARLLPSRRLLPRLTASRPRRLIPIPFRLPSASSIRPTAASSAGDGLPQRRARRSMARLERAAAVEVDGWAERGCAAEGTGDAIRSRRRTSIPRRVHVAGVKQPSVCISAS